MNWFLVDSASESDEELNKTIDRELAKKGGLSTLLASDETPKQTAEDIFAEAAAKGRSVRMWNKSCHFLDIYSSIKLQSQQIIA